MFGSGCRSRSRFRLRCCVIIFRLAALAVATAVVSLQIAHLFIKARSLI